MCYANIVFVRRIQTVMPVTHTHTHTHTHRAHDYCMGLTKYILQQMTTQFRLPTRYLLSHSDEAKQET